MAKYKVILEGVETVIMQGARWQIPLPKLSFRSYSACMVRTGAAVLAICLALTIDRGASVAACLENGIYCSDQYVFSKKLLKRMSCGELWALRNSIFNERGFCFQRKIEAETFDNSDCTIDVFSKLNLNQFESDNAAVILEHMHARFCHEPISPLQVPLLPR